MKGCVISCKNLHMLRLQLSVAEEARTMCEKREERLLYEIERLREALAHYATDESSDGWIAIAALTGKDK